jgi:glutamate synthase domain-containing protein 2/glutamate synthase domain-containing protein 1/glutamate synthase domain-containing protein 3
MKPTTKPTLPNYHRTLDGLPVAEGLYDPRFEHDNCGFGFVAHVKGKPSHQLVQRSQEMLTNMEHRGGCGCDPGSGDGAGVLLGMPDAFLRRAAQEVKIDLPPQGEYAVGMMFLPRETVHRRKCERLFERVLADYDMHVIGWRDVPVDPSVLGGDAAETEPEVRQAFVGMKRSFFDRSDFNRRLYLVRQRVENHVEHGDGRDWPQTVKEQFYLCTLSTNRLVYKGMLTAPQLGTYYKDLQQPDFASHFAVVHSRFSTNTFPSWRLAHPYRYLAHNGEINTIRGNRNWMRARYGSLKSDRFGAELDKLFPILSSSTSDSATLDNALQFLTVNGRNIAHSMLMLIPEAWQNDPHMDPDLRAFFEYHALLMEPWDGPAGVAFTNGRQLGALLDRNGLRPARYYLTDDDLLVMGSEAGSIELPPESIVKKWRLQPGKMLLADFEEGRIVSDDEVKQDLVDMRPWSRWVRDGLIDVEARMAEEQKGGTLQKPRRLFEPAVTANVVADFDGMSTDSMPRKSHVPGQTTATDPDADLLKIQRAFGYTNEDLRMLLYPMAASGAEAVGSMGADTPLACLSDKPQPLFNYFKQLFAQVTNPPLDAIREEMVTSLITYLGHERNLLDESPEHARLLKLRGPVINNEELAWIRKFGESAEGREEFKTATISCLFDVTGGEDGETEPAVALELAVDELCHEVSEAVHDGVSIIILSDKGVSETMAPIPSLLATSAVHHHLIRDGTRNQCGIVIETGEAREGHHFCCLLGYGAGAINPYLALDTIDDLDADGLLPPETSAEEAKYNFVKASHKAILKVASKMGISTVQSYWAAQVFEALGIGRPVIDQYFVDTPSRIGGIGMPEIAQEALMKHRRAFPRVEAEKSRVLDAGGYYQWRRDGEYHQWNPDTVAKLQHAVRVDSEKAYRSYAKLVDDDAKAKSTLRGLMEFDHVNEPVPLAEVEEAKEIVKRFATGAMSFGSISKEAHETLALAMNQIGGKSNSGEGGEDPERYVQLGTNGSAKRNPRRSAIKQVASGRFGVHGNYLRNSDQIQIKVAQGAKPGEGGALGGQKVDEYIAKVRHSTPGVGLISPPPHHDIYSIEDLAQLIHDCKNVNPAADVSVKLVSEVGVGTVAAGVAKAKADHIVIAGFDGGTGNAALSSIKHCGLPWELGLAETQQTLLKNGLRGRVRLQADGGMKTGRDVVIAALLGAEEVGFSTAPLIALGCIMMRVCHLNTCPVGIATQDPELRKKFIGTPENVINFMFFIAEEVRETMASLGFRTFDEMVGRSDCLKFTDLSDHPKQKHLDLSVILHDVEPRSFDAKRKIKDQDHEIDRALDNRLIELAMPAIERGETVHAEVPVRNVNRTCGTMLSGKIAEVHGLAGLPDDTIRFKLGGTAGQSFGAFLARGVTLELEGDANDYVGKGLSGGRIVVYPPKVSVFEAEENIIAGNVIGYGAISGEMYLRGFVGERFCVRNSGADAVAEGCGDHGCEYMTGGRVLVLGKTGRNFAAGMSGGIAYVYDPDDDFASHCNMEMVELGPVDEEEDLATVRRLMQGHADLTDSPVARGMLDHFEAAITFFKRVMPTDYRLVMEKQRASSSVLLGPTSAASSG